MPQEPLDISAFFDFTAYFYNSQEIGRDQFRNHDPDAQLALIINADGTNIDGETGLQTSIWSNPSSSSSSELVLFSPTPPALDTTSDIFPLTSIPIFGLVALDVRSRSQSRSRPRLRPHSCPPVYARTPGPLWFANSLSALLSEVDRYFNSGFDVDQENANFELEFGVQDVDIDDDGESIFFGEIEDVDVEDDGELMIFDWMEDVGVEGDGELMFVGKMEDL